MKDANDFHIDVNKAEGVPGDRDWPAIRINVDNFDEAYKIFMDHGFREARGFGTSFTGSSKYGYLVSPSGFILDLVQ